MKLKSKLPSLLLGNKCQRIAVPITITPLHDSKEADFFCYTGYKSMSKKCHQMCRNGNLNIKQGSNERCRWTDKHQKTILPNQPPGWHFVLTISAEKIEGEQQYRMPYHGMHFLKLYFKGVVIHLHCLCISYSTGQDVSSSTFSKKLSELLT